MQPCPTVTSKERFGLVTVEGQDYRIVDIAMRMLTARELFRAQGFDETYVIDPEDQRETAHEIRSDKDVRKFCMPADRRGACEREH